MSVVVLVATCECVAAVSCHQPAQAHVAMRATPSSSGGRRLSGTPAATPAAPAVFVTASLAPVEGHVVPTPAFAAVAADSAVQLRARLVVSTTVPAAHPQHPANAAGLRLMADESSTFVEQGMHLLTDVRVVFAVPAGSVALGTAVSVSTGVDVPATLASVALNTAVSRSDPSLRLDTQLMPWLSNLTATVDVVTLNVPSLSVGDVVDVTVLARTHRSMLPDTTFDFAASASFAVANVTANSGTTTFVASHVVKVASVCHAATTCNGAGACGVSASGGAQCQCHATWEGSRCDARTLLPHGECWSTTPARVGAWECATQPPHPCLLVFLCGAWLLFCSHVDL